MPIDEKQNAIDQILAQMEQTNMGQQEVQGPSKFGQIMTGIGSVFKRDQDPIGTQDKLRQHVQAPQIAKNKAAREGLQDKLTVATAREKLPSEEKSKKIKAGYKKFLEGSAKAIGLKEKIDTGFIDTMTDQQLGDMPPTEILKLAVQNQRDKDSRRDVQRDRDAAIAERQRNSMLQKFTTKLTDSGIPQIDDALTEIEQIIGELPKDEKGTPKDIPGFGRIAGAVPTLFRGGVAKKLRQAVHKLENVQIKARSGAAVTVPEWQRFIREFGAGRFESEEALLNGLERLRRATEADRAELERGLPQEAQEEYVSRGGRLNRYQEVSAPKEQPAQASGLPPDKAARLEELRRKKAAGTLR